MMFQFKTSLRVTDDLPVIKNGIFDTLQSTDYANFIQMVQILRFVTLSV